MHGYCVFICNHITTYITDTQILWIRLQLYYIAGAQILPIHFQSYHNIPNGCINIACSFAIIS